jgi:hypothetical protein
MLVDKQAPLMRDSIIVKNVTAAMYTRVLKYVGRRANLRASLIFHPVPACACSLRRVCDCTECEDIRPHRANMEGYYNELSFTPI